MIREDFKEGQTVWWFMYAYINEDDTPIDIKGLTLHSGIIKELNEYAFELKQKPPRMWLRYDDDVFISRDEALMALFQRFNKMEEQK